MWRPEALHGNESEGVRCRERRGRQPIWLKEGKEEKETDLGLSLGEAGAEGGRLGKLKGPKISKPREEEERT